MSWTGFHTDFKDLIVIDNSNTDSAPDNAGNVVSKGFELSSTYAPENFKPFGGDISFFANYTFTNANLDGAATQLMMNQLLLVVEMDQMYHTYQTIVYAFGADYEYNDFDFGVKHDVSLRITRYCRRK